MPKQQGKCEICGKIFFYQTSEKAGKFCSRKCWSKIAVKNLKDRFTGKKHKNETIEKMKKSQVGEKHHGWKGEDTGYTAIHKWVERHKGRTKKCEHCGSEDDNKNYDWANKDHKYRRNLNDYIRLCRGCHREYDKKNNHV